jgi:sugar phosphate isomerase/epimerase
MKVSQVGAQLYTVRDHIKDADGLARAVDRLAGIGYRAVELVHSDTISDQEVAKICSSAGVAVAAAHLPAQVVLEQPEKAIEKLHTVNAKIGVYGFPAGVDFGSRAAVEALGAVLQKSAELFRSAELTLAYHNHAVEFTRVGTELAYEIIRSRAPGIGYELDTYWVQYGGMSPLHWTRTLGETLVALHLKDFGVPNKHDEPPFMTEVGAGNLDFPPIVAEAERNGCEWFIVEQDFTPGDPFDSLERSFKYVVTDLVHAEHLL